MEINRNHHNITFNMVVGNKNNINRRANVMDIDPKLPAKQNIDDVNRKSMVPFNLKVDCKEGRVADLINEGK